MGTAITIVMSVAVIALFSIVAIQCLRQGWSTTGYLHDGSDMGTSDYIAGGYQSHDFGGVDAAADCGGTDCGGGADGGGA